MKRTIRRSLLLLCLSLLVPQAVRAVEVYSDYVGAKYADFYVYNNTSDALNFSQGNFGHAGLPATIAPFSAAAITHVDVSNNSSNQGTAQFRLSTYSQDFVFALWALTKQGSAPHTTEWNVYPVGNGWNATAGAVCPCGAVNLSDNAGTVNQFWGDQFVVSLIFALQDGDKYYGTSKIILTVYPSTTMGQFANGVKQTRPW